MLGEYKNACKKIPVPQELIEKTASDMKRAQHKKKAAKTPHYVRYGVLAACVSAVFLSVLLINTLNPKPDIFITSLYEDRHIERVELIDGFLTFQQESEDQIFAPRPNFLGPGIRKEEWEPEKYKSYLGADITSGSLPRDMTLVDESAVVYTSENGRVVLDCYTRHFTSERGGTLEISVSKGRLPPMCDLGRTKNSVIGGNPVAAGVYLDSNVYWAQFLHNGTGFYIESENLSQEAFIRVLYSFFN